MKRLAERKPIWEWMPGIEDNWPEIREAKEREEARVKAERDAKDHELARRNTCRHLGITPEEYDRSLQELRERIGSRKR